MPCRRGSASADVATRSAVCDTSRDGRWSQYRMASALPYASCRPSASCVVMGRSVRRAVSKTGSVISGEAAVDIGKDLGGGDGPGGQGLEPYRAEERLLRLDQEDGLREARIVEAPAEVHARLDGEHLEPIDPEAGGSRQVERVHDLGEV